MIITIKIISISNITNINGNDAWIKNTKNPMFDVSMGSYDGAEVCELVGLYLLERLSSLISKDQIGLYRDDGLAVVNHSSGPQLDRLRKDIISLFKSEGLSITIETNLTETDFLDVSLNLKNGTYSPPYKSGSGRCTLCLTEKSVIIRANPRGLLNKRTELISKCRHRNKYLLCNLPLRSHK